MSRPLLLGVAAMAAIVITSNILVQFLVGDWLTWGAFTYPFAFLVTDLMNRLYGPGAARRVVAAGFVVGLACSFVGSQIEGPFGPLVSLRVAIGSGTAFLVGQLLDVAVFNRLRAGSWWRAPFVSSVVGSVVDTAIFFTIAFSATLALHRAGGGRRLGERGGAAARARSGGAALVSASRPPISWSSSPSPCSRWRRFAPRSGGTPSAAEIALAFSARAGTIGATETSERR